MQVVHGLGALAGAGGENLLVVEGEALALVGGHQEAAAGQGQAGVGAGAGELAGEGALQLELADLLGPGDVGDVQNDEALAVVGQIGQVAHHERRPVELGPVHELPVLGAVHGVLALLQAVGELAGHPPAAHLHRVGGVDDVQDAVDVAGVARAVGRQVDVAPAVVEEAVHAHAVLHAGLPLAQQLGVDGIGLDVEDLQAAQALVAGLAAVEEGDAAAGGADHQAVGHLNLGGVGGGVLLGIAGLQPVDHLGLGGVGHVHHVPAGAAEGAAVHVIAPVVGLMEGHLEGVDAVQIAEAHDLHVLDIALVLRAFGVKGN